MRAPAAGCVLVDRGRECGGSRMSTCAGHDLRGGAEVGAEPIDCGRKLALILRAEHLVPHASRAARAQQSRGRDDRPLVAIGDPRQRCSRAGCANEFPISRRSEALHFGFQFHEHFNNDLGDNLDQARRARFHDHLSPQESVLLDNAALKRAELAKLSLR